MSTKHKNLRSYENYLLESLQNKKEAHAYLQEALREFQKDNDAEAFLVALRNIAQARGGFAVLAQKTNLPRQSLYKALSPKGNPTLSTVGLILRELGFGLAIQAMRPSAN